MDIDTEAAAPQSYTILRIKRKRNEEPLDALVVESRVRRKKSRGGINVFQFAQTVEDHAWKDEKQQKDIQEQISRLARESSTTAEKETSSLSPDVLSSSATQKQQKEDTNRHYTILKHDDTEPDKRRPPTSPPKVISSKDLPLKNLNPDFKVYDAILAVDQPTLPVIDSEMENFLPMLNDYLKLQEGSLDSASQSGTTLINKGTGHLSSSQSDDYVWDVFYHRPTTLNEWNVAANIGTLSGLPLSIMDPYDSVSDSEEEDEADEDSNAEEYYKNDYPEEDDSSDTSDGDESHEDSDYGNYDDNGYDHDWR